MNLEFLTKLALGGDAWVLWLLLASSAVSIGIIIERYWILAKERRALNAVMSAATKPLEDSNYAEAAHKTKDLTGTGANVLQTALRHVPAGVRSMQSRVAIARSHAFTFLNRRMLFLGTMGSNAPFVGLFGTVLGVIKAFHDLAGNNGGSEAAMAGLSEALIATAVGLIVAIPALMAFNSLKKRVDDMMVDIDSLVRLVTSSATQSRSSAAQPAQER